MNTLKKSPKNKSVDYYVADFETTTINSDFYKKHKKGSLIAFEIQKLGDENNKVVGVSMFEFEDWLLSITKPSQVFFHNLARFDGYVLLNWALRRWWNPLQKNSSPIQYTFNKTSHGLLSFSVKINKIDIIFTDSYRLLSMSIGKLGKLVGLEKSSTNYDIGPVYHISQLPKQYLDYLHNDVCILNRALQDWKHHIEIINKKYSLKLKWNSLTAPSIARDIISHFDTKKSFTIRACSQDVASSYYRGGYTSFNFKTRDNIISKDCEMWDAKSHYPSIMVLTNLPSGEPILIDKKDIPKYKCVFVSVKGHLKWNKFSWATIPLRYNEETYIYISKNDYIEPTYFEFRGTLNEWNVVKEYYEFENWEFLEIWGFEETTNCLNNIIKDFYRFKEIEKNSLTYKILLNSLYGAAGMRHDYPTEFYVDTNIEPPKEYVDDNDNEYYFLNKKNTKFFRDYKQYDYYLLKDKNTKCWNRWIAAWITSIGRKILMEIILTDPDKVFYCDTDSILGEKGFEGFKKVNKGKNLGDWDRESDEIKNIYIQGAKRYLFFSETEKIKTGFAGIRKEILPDDFTSSVKIMRDKFIDKGQRRLKLDDEFFPFIIDTDYLNRKVIKWQNMK